MPRAAKLMRFNRNDIHAVRPLRRHVRGKAGLVQFERRRATLTKHNAGESLLHERFLPLHHFQRAARPKSVLFVELRIDELGEKFRRG